MRIITKAEKIRNVAEQWRKAHQGRWNTKEQKEIYGQLACLPADADEDQIAAIIGNMSWTRNECGECDHDVELLIHLGEEPDYDVMWINVCLDCLQKAIELVKEEEHNAANT